MTNRLLNFFHPTIFSFLFFKMEIKSIFKFKKKTFRKSTMQQEVKSAGKTVAVGLRIQSKLSDDNCFAGKNDVSLSER